MNLAIISVGPGTATIGNAVTNATEKVWVKYNQYLITLFYDPSSASYPSGLSKSEVAVLWVEMEDSMKGKFKVIKKETRDFSFNNLDRITKNFLSNYKFSPDPTGSGEPIVTRNNGQTGTGIDAGNKEGAQNDAEGKGGDFGFADWGGQLNLPDWLKNLGPWFWLACAGAGALWFFSTDGKKVIIRVVSGGVTVFCTVNYLQRAKLPFKIPFINGPQIPQPPRKRLLL
jgi:hypothetical protein